jgi:SAM-dependent methyltransferase
MGYYRNPSAGELAQLYSTAWRDPTDTGAFAAGSTSSATAKSLLAAVVPGLRGLGACLDYGAGQGTLAAALVAGGATDVSVLEPYGSQSTASGVVWFSSWDEMPVDKRFDWVFMVEVIEHLLDPIAELVKVRSRMAPGGSLVLTTPNAGGWRARLSRTEWREAQNPTHINLFSPLALQRCLERAGFSDIRRVRRPVRYKRGVAASALLALTQISGIDGGLRMLARAGSSARSRR